MTRCGQDVKYELRNGIPLWLWRGLGTWLSGAVPILRPRPQRRESAALEDGFNLMFMSNEEIANELLVQASNYVRFTPGLLGCSISFNDGSVVRCEL